ncbi:MAG: hypothetical protein JSU96_11825 [Acidobacteriota bacterium]|nr:MAG: hypothetical protein JSU96_11825 [Acidobacteriota bacterium]
MKGKIAAIWGVLGVCLLLGSAVYRLGLRGLEAFSYPLTAFHWITLIVGVVFMAYSEGYKGFQKSFSPRVAARARYLWERADLYETILAPFFLMGYIRATRRRKLVSYSLTAGIVTLVLLVRLLPTPWRQIIDIGVVVGLSWGLASFLVFLGLAFFSESFVESPELPEDATGGSKSRQLSGERIADSVG